MKGVIIAAGYGTRFLPCTKTVPKEMFPLVDTPAIDIIVEEFRASGIKDILIVSSRRKKSLEDYFDREVELEEVFTREKAHQKLAQIEPMDVNIFFVRQKRMLGTGQALLLCKEFIGNDPFVVAYPDDLVFSKVPLARQLMDVHEATGGCVLSVQEIEGDVSRYGVIDFEEKEGVLGVKEIVEKPPVGKQPSQMISVGRYLFTPELFPLLEEQFEKHAGGEFYHIDSINSLAGQGKMFASPLQGERVDVGDKSGYFEGIIQYALGRPDLKDEAERIIKKYAAGLS